MKKILFSIIALLSMTSASAQEDNYSVPSNPSVNQAILTLTGNIEKYYNTADIDNISIDGDEVRVCPKNIYGFDTFTRLVQQIRFRKAEVGQVNITEARGWQESAYLKFDKMEGAKAYNVYVKGGQYAEYTKIDSELVREYPGYFRADIVGLTAGTYDVRVAPVDADGKELADKAGEAAGLEVRSYDRAGYAHFNYSGVGAYNDDGSLKAGAKVFYVTKSTAKTISTNVAGAKLNPCVGLQAIIEGYEKGQDKTPVTFRFIGLVEKDDLDYLGSSAEGLQVKGKKEYSEMNITFEGIGDDATLRGFGFLLRNAKSVEMRNFAIMRCMDDGISLDTDNSNIWVHNIDFFYGKHGSGDHDKGDGACDAKDDSQYCTFSYCRYWDTGKTNMFGMKSESGPNFFSYHHNWFDHSDSRHPRVRTMSVHVWNNFFDNVAKYGVGATSGSSVFVENNYFLKTKKPMLSSKQGTDALGSGTFSGEDGGMIKAFGNYIDRQTPHFSYYTQSAPASTGYDAYETATRDEQVPATEKTRQGGTSYNNFDTDAQLIYAYTPDAASDVPAIVTGYYGAGRMNHGDISYSFPDNTGDETVDSNYDSALAAIIDGYKSQLVAVGDGEGGQQGGGDEPGGGDDPQVSPTPEGTILCTFDKSGNPSTDFFTVSGNGSNSKGTATVDGETLSVCLKMEKATSIKFTIDKPYIMTLYFADTETASIMINGVKIAGTSSTYTQRLEAGSYELTKDKSVNLFAIKLEPVPSAD